MPVIFRAFDLTGLPSGLSRPPSGHNAARRWLIGIHLAGKHEILQPAKGGFEPAKVPLFHWVEGRTFADAGFGFEG